MGPPTQPALLNQNLGTNSCPFGISNRALTRTYNGICYQFVTGVSETFSDAGQECKSHGGSLVVIKDEMMNNFLLSQVKSMVDCVVSCVVGCVVG